MEKTKLTSNQLRTITCILESNSIEAAAKKAKVSRASVYNWLRDNFFKARLERERKALFEEGLNALKGATAKAAETLIGLLECNDRNTKRLVAKEIINMAIKVTEIHELEERICRLEELLDRN